MWVTSEFHVKFLFKLLPKSNSFCLNETKVFIAKKVKAYNRHVNALQRFKLLKLSCHASHITCYNNLIFDKIFWLLNLTLVLQVLLSIVFSSVQFQKREKEANLDVENALNVTLWSHPHRSFRFASIRCVECDIPSI